MRQVTLCYLLRDDEILLGMKKRGFGAGRYNGFGGKPEDGESLEAAAVREFREESGVIIDERDLRKVGEIAFSFPAKPEWDQVVHIYFATEWSGEPRETAEMKPVWCKLAELDYEKMWEVDRHWLPHTIEGRFVKGRAVYSAEQQLVEHNLRIS
ncbi:8-oxo-dGTP diphosphatase [Candidatus Woesearchaeota archaeon]|nr:8-oxo-dGTP diphosphatase [Candidatus Woesearchaeota archaeon]